MLTNLFDPGDLVARSLLYSMYERQVMAQLDPQRLPRHIGVILDGNRRWAKAVGTRTEEGHRSGADKIFEFLGWSQDIGIQVVTLWMLSTDNLGRDAGELEKLLDIIAQTVERLAAAKQWNLHLVGAKALLPQRMLARLEEAIASSQNIPGALTVNIAVGYGGRVEIIDAIKAYLNEHREMSVAEVAAALTEDDITSHMYTSGQPDPDLVIRTSGEQRLSGFLLWQSAYSEYYFCEAFWPAFRLVDYLRALRAYQQRERRLGK